MFCLIYNLHFHNQPSSLSPFGERAENLVDCFSVSARGNRNFAIIYQEQGFLLVVAMALLLKMLFLQILWNQTKESKVGEAAAPYVNDCLVIDRIKSLGF